MIWRLCLGRLQSLHGDHDIERYFKTPPPPEKKTINILSADAGHPLSIKIKCEEVYVHLKKNDLHRTHTEILDGLLPKQTGRLGGDNDLTLNQNYP